MNKGQAITEEQIAKAVAYEIGKILDSEFKSSKFEIDDTFRDFTETKRQFVKNIQKNFTEVTSTLNLLKAWKRLSEKENISNENFLEEPKKERNVVVDNLKMFREFLSRDFSPATNSLVCLADTIWFDFYYDAIIKNMIYSSWEVEVRLDFSLLKITGGILTGASSLKLYKEGINQTHKGTAATQKKAEKLKEEIKNILNNLDIFNTAIFRVNKPLREEFLKRVREASKLINGGISDSDQTILKHAKKILKPKP